jgi:hypothetical protein
LRAAIWNAHGSTSILLAVLNPLAQNLSCASKSPLKPLQKRFKVDSFLGQERN